MVTIIPNRVEKIWEAWNVRDAILLSFFIQMFLVLFAPLRIRSDSMLLRFAIWSAYLLADWAANFSLGLISSNSGDYNNAAKDNLMALLWLSYVFVLTVPQNALWAPTLLIFVAGIIKYSERTCALYIASNNILGEQSKKPTLLDEKGVKYYEAGNRRSPLGRAVNEEYEVQKLGKWLVNDMKPLAVELEKYCDKRNFGMLADKSYLDVLEEIEVLCEFIYETYYTKASILRKKVACAVRFVAFSSIVVALGLFTSMEKNGSYKFDKIDVEVTYALFYGAFFLETISLFKLIFSEWMVTISNESSHNNSYLGHVIKLYQVTILKPVMSLQRPRKSKCKKMPYTHFEELSTPFLFRKWCGSMSGLNLFTICLGQRHPKKQYFLFKLVEFLEGAFHHIARYFGATELKLSKYKVKNAFVLDLWQFIFADLLIMQSTRPEEFTLKQRIAVALNKRARLREKRIYDLVNGFLDHPLMEEWRSHGVAEDRRTLILWHVTTDLCYAHDDEQYNVAEDDGANKRHLIKLLSNYMLYLLLMQPNMMSEVTVIEKFWFRDTYVDAIRFIQMEDLNRRDHLESREREVLKRLYARTVQENGEHHLLFEACKLAEKLMNQLSREEKWEVIGIILLQMLSFVAAKCRPSIHAQQLSRGGGLVSLVWLASLLLDQQCELMEMISWEPSSFGIPDGSTIHFGNRQPIVLIVICTLL
ncbi:hypothetical protein K1719_035255 [Acacia pycnantha]|nr:hypothetical protein K1719_035255 [Acacia pycnantha]